MRTILVTGSEGGVGAFIVKKLYHYFDDIHVIRTGRSRSTDFNKGMGSFYYGDLTDSKFCRKIFAERKITDIIHCAARWSGFNTDWNILNNNFASINNVLHAASGSVKKVIFFSSSAVYQDVDPLESSKINNMPQSAYGVSKLLGEDLVKQFSQSNQTSYTIYRPFHIVSPFEQFERGRSHVVTDMCHRIISCNEKIDLKKLSDMKKIGFTWVGDVADLVVHNMDNNKFSNEIFNVGTSELHSVRELVEEILKLAVSFRLTDQTAMHQEKGSNAIKPDKRFSKLTQLCNWSAQTGFSDCIKKFIEAKYL